MRRMLNPQEVSGRIVIYPADAEPLSPARPVALEEAPSLRDYWQVTTKHRWKIIACMLIALTATAGYLLLRKPVYTARATLMIDRRGPQIVDIKQVLAESGEIDEHNFY